jgi:peroxiredoxin
MTSTRPDLQTQLDQITSTTRELVQADRLAVTDTAVQELMSTGIEDRVLRVGEQAPAFALPDASTGKLVRSSDLLALGTLVIKFFRGRWCPYCMTELETWQSLYPELRERGALLVAISPQTPRQNDFTVQQHSLAYPVLTDTRAQVAAAYGVTYTVPPAMQKHYRSILVNIPFINGDDTWQLPLPATFVISREGTVLFSEAYADHRVRPDPADVLSVL